MKTNYKERYNSLGTQLSVLEIEVFQSLKEAIEKSDYVSIHTGTKAIKLDNFINGYTELVISNNKLVFLNNTGYEISLPNDECTLEDYIDILEYWVVTDETIFDKAVKFVQEKYIMNTTTVSPFMLLGDVADLIKITTGKEVDVKTLSTYSVK